jgi:hypothetical protein
MLKVAEFYRYVFGKNPRHSACPGKTGSKTGAGPGHTAGFLCTP